MRKEVAQYLFQEETLYQFPSSQTGQTTDYEMEVAPSVPQTDKKHVWCFGEKPVEEKRDLMVKLLQACQLKGADVEFYFSSLPIEAFLKQNTHVETCLVFGSRGGEWPVEWPKYELLSKQGAHVLYSFTLDELIANVQQEKRTFWNWLKTIYSLT